MPMIRRAMKTTPFRFASVGLAVFTAVFPALLFAATPSPKEREVRQQERIGHGIKSGELTPAEAARLEGRVAELRRQIARDRAANGGKLTPDQRKEIKAELDELSARIAKQKHDAQKTNTAPKSVISKRERRQQQRIGEGVSSGQLTPAETARLEARVAELHRQIAQDRADGGKLTMAERKKIQAELDELSAKIAKQKHDAHLRTPGK